MPENLYTDSNTVGTMMKYSKKSTTLSAASTKSNIGTCAALAAVFLKNWFSKIPGRTKPDPVLAQIVFSRCWIKFGAGDVNTFNHANITAARLTGKEVYPNVGGLADNLKYMAENPDFYYIDLQQGHVVAAVTSGGFYFYDSNSLGLSKYSDAGEFKTEVAVYLANQGWQMAPTPWLYSVVDA